jgi:hypothetical protein
MASRGTYVRAFAVAFNYLRAGDVEKALPWLERSLVDRDWLVRYGWSPTERLPGMPSILGDTRIVAFRTRAAATPPPVP